MKNWSTTKKILVVLGFLILVALIVVGVKNYNKTKKEADIKRIANRTADALMEKKAAESITGDQLTTAIRNNLAKQPVSEISAKFYQS